MIVGSACSAHAEPQPVGVEPPRPSAARQACRSPSRRSRRGSAPARGVVTARFGRALRPQLGERRGPSPPASAPTHRLRASRRADRHRCRAAPMPSGGTGTVPVSSRPPPSAVSWTMHRRHALGHRHQLLHRPAAAAADARMSRGAGMRRDRELAGLDRRRATPNSRATQPEPASRGAIAPALLQLRARALPSVAPSRHRERRALASSGPGPLPASQASTPISSSATSASSRSARRRCRAAASPSARQIACITRLALVPPKPKLIVEHRASPAASWRRAARDRRPGSSRSDCRG